MIERIRQLRWELLPSYLVDGFAIAMGCWWLFSMAIVYTGQSFSTLRLTVWIPLLASLAGMAWLLRPPAEPAPAPEVAPLPREAWAALPLVAMGLGAWWGLGQPFFVAWVPMLGWLGLLLWHTQAVVAAPAPVLPSRRDAISLVLATSIAFALVSGLHRPEVDDAYHINAMISALEHPELAVLSFDGMHGDEGAPLQQLIHRPQTYEIFVAALSSWSGLDPRDLYWLWLPALFGPLTMISVWRLCKAFAPDVAWLAVLLVIVVWVAWGDDYRVYGAYSFTRLFQGKPVFICLFVPAIWYAAARFAAQPTGRHFALLTLSQCATVGFTSSGLLLAPIVAGMGLLSQARPTRWGLATFATGLLGSVPLIGVLVLVKLELSGVGGLRHDGWMRGMQAVLGTSVRSPLALLGLATAPALALATGQRGATWMVRAAAVCVLLVFNGVTAPLLAANAAELFSWRLYWTVPVPIFLALGLALLTHAGWQRRDLLPRLALIAGALGLVLGFWFADTRSVGRMAVKWQWWSWKTPRREHLIARAVVRMTDPEDLVLAAPHVAERITGLDGRPGLVSVRESYLRNLSRYWGPEEAGDRYAMMRLAGEEIDAEEMERGLAALAERCVAVVVLRRRDVHAELGLDSRLIELGYERVDTHRRHIVYRAGESRCAAPEARP